MNRPMVRAWIRITLPAFLLVNLALPVHGAEFHTDPACWDEPRVYHAGTPPADLSNRVHLIETPANTPIQGEGRLSPNGAYRFWLRNPVTTKPAPWGAGLIVDADRDKRPTLLFQNVAQPISPRWINEKLIYLRVAWGRIIFSDIIFDVENNELIYHEQAIYGENAYQQFRQQCQGRCPCDATAVTDSPTRAETVTSHAGLMPSSQPGENALIGILKLPTIFGPGESGPLANPTPVPVYDRPEAGAIKLGEPADAKAFKSKEWGYEAPGAVVYAKRPGWYQIGLADGRRVWLSAQTSADFLPIGQLLIRRLAYLNSHWDRKVWEAPTTFKAWNSKLRKTPGARVEIPVNILQFKQVNDGLWLKVETLAGSPCESPGEPEVVDRGWIPAYAKNGALAADYYSRGC